MSARTVSLTAGAKQAAEHARVRRHIFDWIRDDVGMAAKMTLTPQICDKLVDRIVGSTTHHVGEVSGE